MWGCPHVLAVGLAPCPGCGANLSVLSRRVCAVGQPSRRSAHTESHVQPVYQPYLTTCQGHRLCSTYRTIYRVAYRQRYRQVPEPTASCCPGWSRANGHTLGCNREAK
ncbi:Epidermal growth factor-like protein 7 [Lamprotornis superbus]|uniref:Epidermal growth factor-like protein 7 n=1 Tax=Lamprotornis superbus TaxID=245042 RepID=A0A835NVV5_9PASS|nr:Epidermal growth factor-like protein 7 [Lamprotornis superbus]